MCIELWFYFFEHLLWLLWVELDGFDFSSKQLLLFYHDGFGFAHGVFNKQLPLFSDSMLFFEGFGFYQPLLFSNTLLNINLSIEFDHLDIFFVPHFIEKLHLHDFVTTLLKLKLFLPGALIKVDTFHLRFYFVPLSICNLLYPVLCLGELWGTLSHQKFVLRQACLSWLHTHVSAD